VTALTADAIIPWKSEYSTGVVSAYPVKDNVKIYKGAIVCIDTTGYATVGADTASFVCAGIAVEQADNTVTGHTAGGIKVRVRSGARFLLPATGLAQTSVGLQAKVADSGATALTSSNNVNMGKYTEYVSATLAWVYVSTPGMASGS
jgi:hypothetical protein